MLFNKKLNSIAFLILLLLLLLFTPKDSFAQYRLPFNKDFHNSYINQVEDHHSSVKPFVVNQIVDTTFKNIQPPFKSTFLNSAWNKVFNDHFISVDTGIFNLTIDPLIGFSIGKESGNENNITWTNTRGFWIKGNIGPKFAFASRLYENQAKFSSYIADFIRSNKTVPGQGGRPKSFKQGLKALDYAYSSGYISYSPTSYFNFQFGHGKNFFGDGYRSLLLSDASFNYPFFKITTSIWKIRYVNLFTQFLDIQRRVAYTLGYPKKFGSFHYLDINIGKRLYVGLFESIIWQAEDSLGQRGFDINYLNPIIFYHPVQSTLGHGDNAVLGLNISYQIKNDITAYGQFVLDDLNLNKTKKGTDTTKSTFYNLTHVQDGGLGFFQNKWGYQLGIKYFNVAGINGLFFQTEYNRVRPHVYAHKTPMQNYGHYNQSLAHPLGANFWETVTFLSYQYNRWYIEAEGLYAEYGADTSGSNWGKNIYLSDYNSERGHLSFGNYIGQGVRTLLTYSRITGGFVVNPATNLRLGVTYVYRNERSAIEQNKTNWFYISLSTNLRNIYYDF